MDNYIPHKVKNPPSFKKWFENYERDIINMHSIVLEILNERYDIEENINTKDELLAFAKLIYNCSSKYILK